MATFPEGWYADQHTPGQDQYWDGTAWTGDVRASLLDRPATAPAGWYDDGSGGERWWDGSEWAAPGAVEVSPKDAPRRPAPRPRVWLLAGGAALLVAAAVVTAVVAFQPRDAGAAPLGRADLDALVLAVAGTSLPERTGDADILEGTTPAGCGIVAQLGSGLWSPDDTSSGLGFYQVWGYAQGDGAPWVNARLFPGPDEAQRFVDQLQDALSLCPQFTRPGAAEPLTATNVTAQDGVLRFDYASPDTHVVITHRENAVFALIFDGTDEDPSYLAALG